MKRLLTLALPILLLAACKKDGETTPPDESTVDADDGAGVGQGEPEDPVVPQDPDPPELARALAQFILGDMEAVKGSMEPLMNELAEPSQARANGIASALYALAVAEELAENAKEPAENAAAKGEEVRDAEVQQLAHVAMGAHLVGVGDAAAAQAQLEAALALQGPNATLARLYLAQAHLNQAFDESDKLTNPGKLDEAEVSYQKAIDETQDAGLKGRGLAGLAALAKYRGKKADICTQAKAATEQYEAASASEYLKEVPAILASEAKCK